MPDNASSTSNASNTGDARDQKTQAPVPHARRSKAESVLAWAATICCIPLIANLLVDILLDKQLIQFPMSTMLLDTVVLVALVPIAMSVRRNYKLVSECMQVDDREEAEHAYHDALWNTAGLFALWELLVAGAISVTEHMCHLSDGALVELQFAIMLAVLALGVAVFCIVWDKGRKAITSCAEEK